MVPGQRAMTLSPSLKSIFLLATEGVVVAVVVVAAVEDLDEVRPGFFFLGDLGLFGLLTEVRPREELLLFRVGAILKTN